MSIVTQRNVGATWSEAVNVKNNSLLGSEVVGIIDEFVRVPREENKVTVHYRKDTYLDTVKNNLDHKIIRFVANAALVRTPTRNNPSKTDLRLRGFAEFSFQVKVFFDLREFLREIRISDDVLHEWTYEYESWNHFCIDIHGDVELGSVGAQVSLANRDHLSESANAAYEEHKDAIEEWLNLDGTLDDMPIKDAFEEVRKILESKKIIDVTIDSFFVGASLNRDPLTFDYSDDGWGEESIEFEDEYGILQDIESLLGVKKVPKKREAFVGNGNPNFDYLNV